MPPPALSDVLPAIERPGLHVTDIEILRINYAETLKVWREQSQTRRSQGALRSAFLSEAERNEHAADRREHGPRVTDFHGTEKTRKHRSVLSARQSRARADSERPA